ncbi:hypothetical protein F4815DRAFT_117044 [Daldinia loculata]|nr:hypothetical protein F4815DRAFT_117044 [Daldinia loculata]
MLAGKPLSINSGETLVNLGRGSVDQLEFSFKLEFHPVMYNKVRLLIHRNSFSESKHMRQIWVGAMEFYFQSITKVSATRMPKDSASVMITEGFVASGGPAVEIDTGALRLSFNVSRAFFYHDKNKVVDSEAMQAQMKQIVEFVESVGEQFPDKLRPTARTMLSSLSRIRQRMALLKSSRSALIMVSLLTPPTPTSSSP